MHLELSQAQVDQVVREASGSGNMSVLLAGLHAAKQAIEDHRELPDSRQLSRSLLLGLLVLAAIPSDGSKLSITEIANQLGLNTSTTHRYVSTLVAMGLLQRDPDTRRYGLVQ